MSASLSIQKHLPEKGRPWCYACGSYHLYHFVHWECSNVKCTVIIPVGQTRSQCAKDKTSAMQHTCSNVKRSKTCWPLYILLDCQIQIMYILYYTIYVWLASWCQHRQTHTQIKVTADSDYMHAEYTLHCHSKHVQCLIQTGWWERINSTNCGWLCAVARFTRQILAHNYTWTNPHHKTVIGMGLKRYTLAI